MPPAMLKSLARKAGVSLATAERYWEAAKKGTDKGWTYIVGIVKHRLGLEDANLVLAGWPVRLVLEAEEPPEVEKFKSFTFSVEDLEESDRGRLLKQLQDGDFKVVWELLKGQVLMIPGVSEDAAEKLEKILKKFKLKSKETKEEVEPDLVSLFLLEFYRVHELDETSQVVRKDEKVTAESLVETVELFESTAEYRRWLEALFPNAAYELIAFIADQGADA